MLCLDFNALRIKAVNNWLCYKLPIMFKLRFQGSGKSLPHHAYVLLPALPGSCIARHSTALYVPAVHAGAEVPKSRLFLRKSHIDGTTSAVDI